MVDLGRWLNGNYQVAGEPASGTDDAGGDALEEPVDDDSRIR